MLPETQVLLFGGCQAKTQSSQRVGVGRIHYLQQVRNTWDLSQSSISLNSNISEILS